MVVPVCFSQCQNEINVSQANHDHDDYDFQYINHNTACASNPTHANVFWICIDLINNGFSEMDYEWVYSCTNIQHTSTYSRLEYNAAFSCVNSSFIVYLASRITSVGVYSLTNSIITVADYDSTRIDPKPANIVESKYVEISLNGYFAGFNLTILYIVKRENCNWLF